MSKKEESIVQEVLPVNLTDDYCAENKHRPYICRGHNMQFQCPESLLRFKQKIQKELQEDSL